MEVFPRETHKTPYMMQELLVGNVVDKVSGMTMFRLLVVFCLVQLVELSFVLSSDEDGECHL